MHSTRSRLVHQTRITLKADGARHRALAHGANDPVPHEGVADGRLRPTIYCPPDRIRRCVPEDR